MYSFELEINELISKKIRDAEHWAKEDRLNKQTPQERERKRQAEMKRRGITDPLWGTGSGAEFL